MWDATGLDSIVFTPLQTEAAPLFVQDQAYMAETSNMVAEANAENPSTEKDSEAASDFPPEEMESSDEPPEVLQDTDSELLRPSEHSEVHELALASEDSSLLLNNDSDLVLYGLDIDLREVGFIDLNLLFPPLPVDDGYPPCTCQTIEDIQFNPACSSILSNQITPDVIPPEISLIRLEESILLLMDFYFMQDDGVAGKMQLIHSTNTPNSNTLEEILPSKSLQPPRKMPKILESTTSYPIPFPLMMSTSEQLLTLSKMSSLPSPSFFQPEDLPTRSRVGQLIFPEGNSLILALVTNDSSNARLSHKEILRSQLSEYSSGNNPPDLTVVDSVDRFYGFGFPSLMNTGFQYVLPFDGFPAREMIGAAS